MEIIRLLKAAAYAYSITVLRRVAAEIDRDEKEIIHLSVNASESDMLRIERLSKRVDRGNKQLDALRSLLGHN